MFSPKFLCQNQGIVIRNIDHILFIYAYRAITLYGRPFQVISASQTKIRSSPTTLHSHIVSYAGSVWTFPLSLAATKGIPFGFFSSPYLDASVREVPPPQRECRKNTAGGPIRASPDRRLHAPTRSLSQLATPFFGAQAKPSVKWRSMPNFEANTRQVLRLMHGFHNDN